MEVGSDFQDQLEHALEKQRELLEKKELVQLKELYRLFHTAFKTIYNILQRKALLIEDPYKHEYKISEVEAPPSGPFMESEKMDQMSMRLSSYESQLEFLWNYYQFSVDFLNLERIKRLVGLTKYITWGQVTETASDINTRTFAEIVNKVRQGNDSLSTGIINDSLTQLEKAMKQCLSILKHLTDYHREYYKYEMRYRVFKPLNLDEKFVTNKRDEAMKQIKRQFSSVITNKPFYGELIQEIIEEDYSPDSANLRAALLKKLAVEEKKTKKANNELLFKQMLLEAAKLMASSGAQIEDAIRKLQDNSIVLATRKLTFGERFKEWLLKVFQKNEKSLIYEVEYFDQITSTTKTERIDFLKFMDEASKKARLFAAINNKMSPTYRKLEAGDEERLFAFINANLEDLQLMHRKMTSLDTYFKSETTREQRARLRGITIELTGIKNAIVKTNQKKHEYVAKHEELDQLKKLGINTEVD